ncbi:MAG: peptide chain release factor N(5)-glutamine methyltransferase [Dehalococcoidales bacterium]|nr:peptide chain release factor N(5)-glutamine methyltransferase [Dehalococcoidales bacterium]
MTVREALARAQKAFVIGKVEDARLESELLLRHALRIDRVQLYQEPERRLASREAASFWRLVERRLGGEPTAYITGCREFYGLSFSVDSNVLIPRPESELLVDTALRIVRRCPVVSVAEIGTGCGAIAIILALNLPEVRIYATDISAPALKMARLNCRSHGVADRICLLAGDMLDPLPGPVDLIVANLPYVPQREVYRLGLADFEPLLALDGGCDGLEEIGRLCRDVGDRLHPGGFLLMEIGLGQGRAVTALLRRLFPSAGIEVFPDLAGIDRMVVLSLDPVGSSNSREMQRVA